MIYVRINLSIKHLYVQRKPNLEASIAYLSLA
nr:MAG TPA: hypothetical protein [Bacteriophage sp.]